MQRKMDILPNITLAEKSPFNGVVINALNVLLSTLWEEMKDVHNLPPGMRLYIRNHSVVQHQHTKTIPFSFALEPNNEGGRLMGQKMVYFIFRDPQHFQNGHLSLSENGPACYGTELFNLIFRSVVPQQQLVPA